MVVLLLTRHLWKNYSLSMSFWNTQGSHLYDCFLVVHFFIYSLPQLSFFFILILTKCQEVEELFPRHTHSVILCMLLRLWIFTLKTKTNKKQMKLADIDADIWCWHWTTSADRYSNTLPKLNKLGRWGLFLKEWEGRKSTPILHTLKHLQNLMIWILSWRSITSI